ncbi:hypothetical protein NBRC3280_2278 [Acetobacter pasteurianus NBRC 3280]|uniref:Uncharacterized protein n=1 Tax=Acetobacter pasteurianus NBRC 3278 TaxID=1226660 RepID=A0A401X5R3_ACEPA|nr:hypothetical protein [Acetobacter pasteurianus]GCD59762.1 hypothetical protein NBRC3277_2337 [Acetobacter pasteurianus NBRC 3277]GCD63272.1 hypothetical protein NBRC3278_2365 [Acetobacter pasteurianus NBRC 3278]GCD69643.1 hypothetical protein NBRC3280_2278 [Acetobacter pasteurianus NBRC 3280]
MVDAVKIASWALNPTGMLINEAIKRAQGQVDAASDKGMDELQAEIAKQEIRLQFELKQAKIAQELAIAQRISDADTVEIEEFYDLSGKVKAGVNVDEKAINVGLSGEGSRVTKRIYTFKGRMIPTQTE